MSITLGKLSRQEIAMACALCRLIPSVCCSERVSSSCFLFPHLLSSFLLSSLPLPSAFLRPPGLLDLLFT